MMVKKIINQIKNRFFPSRHQLMLRKWYADGGDYKLRYKYNLGKSSLAFDVGGYQGQWASDLFSRYCCHICVFEPVSEFAEEMRKRFTQNDKIEIFQFGLGGSSRTEVIHISNESSSIFGKSQNREKAQIVDVNEWIKKKGIDKIDLMKVNIEGGEYELLDRLLSTRLIEKIENIQIQFHNISNSSRSDMERIHKELRKTHNLTYQYEFVWENWALDNTI